MFASVIDAMEEGCVPYGTAAFRLQIYLAVQGREGQTGLSYSTATINEGTSGLFGGFDRLVSLVGNSTVFSLCSNISLIAFSNQLDSLLGFGKGLRKGTLWAFPTSQKGYTVTYTWVYFESEGAVPENKALRGFMLTNSRIFTNVYNTCFLESSMSAVTVANGARVLVRCSPLRFPDSPSARQGRSQCNNVTVAYPRTKAGFSILLRGMQIRSPRPRTIAA
jgi:hypothetical protein